MDKKRKTTFSPLNRLPNGLYYYTTKSTLQGSSQIYHSIKDGMVFKVESSLGKEVVNLTLLSGSQRENPEKIKVNY